MSAIAGHTDLVECRATAAGTWYLATRADGGRGGLLRLGEDVALDGMVTLTGRMRDLDLPGVLPITDLVRHRGRIWLVTGLPPIPSLADLLDERVDIAPAHAADALRRTASALLALHRAGLAHGAATADAIVIGEDGSARLADWVPGGRAAADVAGWAELARLLARTWCAHYPRAGSVLAKAGLVAMADGLEAAVGHLHGLPAVACPVDSAVLRRLAADRVGKVAVPDRRASVTPAGRRAGPGPAAPLGRRADRPAPAPRPERPAAPPASARPAPPNDATVPAPPVPASTLLGERRAGRFAAPPTAPAPRPGEVRRFGPGVPTPEVAASRAEQLWRAGAAPARAPRRRAGRLVGGVVTVLVVAAALLVGLSLRAPSALVVTAAAVELDPRGPACDGTAEITGLISTNGGSGTITYRWIADGVREAATDAPLSVSGQDTVRVALNWPFEGASNGDHVARLEIVAPQQLSAEQRFVYRCTGG